MKYVIGTLPRSGSFLASQLIEEYLVRKYKYKRLPFYEYLSYSTVKKPQGTVECLIENDEITYNFTDAIVDEDNELAKRMTLLNYQAHNDITYLNKLIWPSSPDYAWQFYARQGYAFIFIERKDVLQQIVSFVLASKTGEWHNRLDSQEIIEANEKFKDLKETFAIGRDAIERQLIFLAQMRNIAPWTNHRTVQYEDFANNYDQLFIDLQFDDYKKYLPNFDFVKSKPSKASSDPSKILTNYEEACEWVDEINNELSGNNHPKQHETFLQNRTTIL